MKNFLFDDSYIKILSGDNSLFLKGLDYFYNQKVVNFKYFKDAYFIKATVSDVEDYNVEIYLNIDNSIKSATCSCSHFNSLYFEDQICEHIVSVLKTTQQKLIALNDKNIFSLPTVNSLFYVYDKFIQPSKSKQILKCELFFSFLVNEENYIDTFLEIKLGNTKTYVIKNFYEFLLHYRNSKNLILGKNFEYIPAIHCFSKPITDFFDTITKYFELNNYFSPESSYLFSSKSFQLPVVILEDLFSKLENCTVYSRFDNTSFSKSEITRTNLPISFELYNNITYISFKLNDTEPVIPILPKNTVVYYKNNIHILSKNYIEKLFPLLNIFSSYNNDTLILNPLDGERFISEIFPILKDTVCININDNLQKILYKYDFNSNIYLDRHKKGISLKLEFLYDQNSINAFSNEITSTFDKIIIRDIDKEREILEILENSNFKVGKDGVYIDSEEKIFDFLVNCLPKLQVLCNIFYSDEFKNLQIKNTNIFSGGIHFNHVSDMLELDIQLKDSDPGELEALFLAIRKKKKYFKLKNGAFLSLDSDEIVNTNNLIEQLHIPLKELSKGKFNVPKFRTLFINSILEEQNISFIEKKSSFNSLLKNIDMLETTEFKIPNKLNFVLRDYQKIGFKWLKTLSSCGFGGILADDMGLGKTLQVLAFILSEKSKKKSPVLVVAPSTLIYNWKDEIQKFTPKLKFLIINGHADKRKKLISKISKVDIVITSYPLIRRDIDLYENIYFSYCFLDEAQYIKTPTTLNALSVKSIKAGGFFALTGTPIENSLSELWSIFDFIMPGYLFSYSKFKNDLELPIIKFNDIEAGETLRKLIKPFILRRLKKDVLKELPKKIETKLTAVMTDEQRKIYLSYLTAAKNNIFDEVSKNGFEKSQIKILAILTRLRQICCHPSTFIENYNGNSGKMVLLEEILQDSINAGHRILIFSQFTSMLKIIKEFLDKTNLSYYYLDGSTKSENRIDLVHNFNNGEKNIFLISLKAGGIGLNLTGADTVIHFDPWWNPSVEEQATDRVYRIGQENSVQVMKIITENSIEEKIYELQQKKKSIIDSIIQPGENFLNKLTYDELLDLFE